MRAGPCSARKACSNTGSGLLPTSYFHLALQNRSIHEYQDVRALSILVGLSSVSSPLIHFSP